MSLFQRAVRPRPALTRQVSVLSMLVLLSFAQPGAASAAEPLPLPQTPVILTVSGNIGVTNAESGAVFDREMLRELGLVTLETSTPWTDGVPVFSGILVRTLLERVAAEGTMVDATALNDYKVSIPIEDFMSYDVLLAMEMNGQEMQISDKGPLWIVYPRDDEPALQDRRLHDRWIWQLKALHVQ